MVSRSIKAFFNRPEFKRELPLTSPWEIIRWWESRRVFFNMVVACTGILTCILCIACAVIAESVVGEAIGMPDGPLLGVFFILFYGILANVFYTGGWIAELTYRTSSTAERSGEFAVKAFRAGMGFAILLTLCPAVLSWLAFTIALLHGQKHGPPGE
ncbi:MAG TPA: hypothetical protein VIJ53_01315 [Acidobacteriaceae bacterium]